MSIGYFSLVERHVLSSIHNRYGPSYIGGFFGVLQPISDLFKLLFKKVIFTKNINCNKINFIIFVQLALTLNIINFLPFLISGKNLYYSGDGNIKKYSILIFFILFSLVETPILFFFLFESKIVNIAINRTFILSASFMIPFFLFFASLEKKSFSNCILNIQNCSFANFISFIIFYNQILIIVLLIKKKFPFDIVESEHELSTGLFIEAGGYLYALFVVNELLLSFFIISLLYSFIFFFLKNTINNVFMVIVLIFNVIFFFLIRSALPNTTQVQIVTIC